MQCRMSALCLLVFTLSCFVHSSRHKAGVTILPQVTHPAKVLKNSQEGCSTDALRELIAEVNEDLDNVLRHMRK